MATAIKHNAFVADIFNGVHNLASDQIVVALSNAAPTASDSQLSDITEISYSNLSSRNITTTSSTQTGGAYELVVQDLVLTASGSVGPFRYVTFYNGTSTGDRLISSYDYGSSITMANGETFTVDASQLNGLLDAS